MQPQSQSEVAFQIVEAFLKASASELNRLEVEVQNGKARLTCKGLRGFYGAYKRFLKAPEGLDAAIAVSKSPFLTAKIVGRAKRYLLTRANAALAAQSQPAKTIAAQSASL